MSKKFLMALVGIVGAASLIALPAPASASEEEQGYWATTFRNDPCYDRCTSHLPFCTCYVLPDIIIP